MHFKTRNFFFSFFGISLISNKSLPWPSCFLRERGKGEGDQGSRTKAWSRAPGGRFVGQFWRMLVVKLVMLRLASDATCVRSLSKFVAYMYLVLLKATALLQGTERQWAPSLGRHAALPGLAGCRGWFYMVWLRAGPVPRQVSRGRLFSLSRRGHLAADPASTPYTLLYFAGKTNT